MKISNFATVAAVAFALSGIACTQESSEETTDNWDFSEDELRVGDSCSPARAAGVIPKKQKAFLDTIAFAEGTRNAGGADGYNVLFSFKLVSECTNHPNQTICRSGYCSTAAGRYQFLSKTWKGLRLPTFKPENQERGAMTLLKWRKAVVPADHTMTATEFKAAMDRAAYEWASLPPGRYGQPQKSLSALRAVYCSGAGGC